MDMEITGIAVPPGVSILVFVELALDGRRYLKRLFRTSGVSILVFVELALDVGWT